MRKFVVLAVASVILSLGFAGFALVDGRLGGAQDAQDLSLGASLDSGPVPVAPSSYDLSAHQTLSRVILLIRENYVDPSRIQPYDMFISALNHIQKTVPEVLVDDAEAPRRVTVAVGTAQQTFDLGGLDQLWEVTMALRDIFRFLQQHISDIEVRREIEYAAINGMLATLDPHSVLLKPESFDEVKLSTKGEFGGLGIVISIRDAALTIISPIEGTPASRSGIKAKDTIVKIGEESTINMSLEEAVHRLRGKPGTKVAIWVMRKGWTEPRKFVLTRAVIKIESVTSKLLADKVGYIKIKSFQNNTYDDLRVHLEKMRKQNRGELQGLVLDLRNNPGGLLDQAIDISDRFIDRGPIVITVGEGNRKREVKQARFSGTELGYPIVVLVNGGSASASEIVSGALKNHGRAVVIGQQTFGKGSVQVLYDFKDRSALKLTIAQYLTPGDISIQSVGIMPDVEIVPVTMSDDAIQVFADRHAPREKDLDKHLDRHAETTRHPETPALRITNFLSKEELEAAGGDEEGADAFVNDFEVRLAHDILVQAGGVTAAEEVLKRAAPLFEKHIAEQEARIAAEFQRRGIDWAVGPKRGTPHAELTFATARGTRPAKAGEELTLTATVTNTGDAPLYRVYGVTASDNPMLDSLEFVFGRVDPGQTRSWNVKVKLPADLSSRGDQVTLNLDDAHGVTKEVKTALLITTEGPQRPRFAYRAFIDDSEGNGDGLLQPDEQVSLRVEVQNLGPGVARDVFATTKNLSGEAVYLDRGRESLGKLEVGATATARLHFSVRQATEAVKLRMMVWDNELGGTLSETLEFPVKAPQRRRAEPRTLRVSRAEGAPVFGGADEGAPVVGMARAGANLRSDSTVEGWRRIDLGDGRFGFLRQEDVEVVKGGKRGAKDAIQLVAGEAPPELRIELDTYVTSRETLRLRGTVRDDGPLQDIFVFVNDRKVFYRALADVPLVNGSFSMPLELDLPLQQGSNAVAVVVRENDELVTRQLLGVYRDAPKELAEADGSAAPVRP